jgi:hypothetical protein
VVRFSNCCFHPLPPTTACLRVVPYATGALYTLSSRHDIPGVEHRALCGFSPSEHGCSSVRVGSSEGDPNASWRGSCTKKQVNEDGNEVIARRMALYGYEVNLAAGVGTGFVSGVSVSRASEHETRRPDEFVRPGTRLVHAQKGYVGNRQYPRDEAIIDGTMAKATRGHSLTEQEKEHNARIVKKRRIVEGACSGVGSSGINRWKKTRFMGLVRYRVGARLTAKAWNSRRWAIPELEA